MSSTPLPDETLGEFAIIDKSFGQKYKLQQANNAAELATILRPGDTSLDTTSTLYNMHDRVVACHMAVDAFEKAQALPCQSTDEDIKMAIEAYSKSTLDKINFAKSSLRQVMSLHGPPGVCVLNDSGAIRIDWSQMLPSLGHEYYFDECRLITWEVWVGIDDAAFMCAARIDGGRDLYRYDWQPTMEISKGQIIQVEVKASYLGLTSSAHHIARLRYDDPSTRAQVDIESAGDPSSNLSRLVNIETELNCGRFHIRVKPAQDNANVSILVDKRLNFQFAVWSRKGGAKQQMTLDDVPGVRVVPLVSSRGVWRLALDHLPLQVDEVWIEWRAYLVDYNALDTTAAAPWSPWHTLPHRLRPAADVSPSSIPEIDFVDVGWPTDTSGFTVHLKPPTDLTSPAPLAKFAIDLLDSSSDEWLTGNWDFKYPNDSRTGRADWHWRLGLNFKTIKLAMRRILNDDRTSKTLFYGPQSNLECVLPEPSLAWKAPFNQLDTALDSTSLPTVFRDATCVKWASSGQWAFQPQTEAATPTLIDREWDDGFWNTMISFDGGDCHLLANISENELALRFCTIYKGKVDDVWTDSPSAGGPRPWSGGPLLSVPDAFDLTSNLYWVNTSGGIGHTRIALVSRAGLLNSKIEHEILMHPEPDTLDDKSSLSAVATDTGFTAIFWTDKKNGHIFSALQDKKDTEWVVCQLPSQVSHLAPGVDFEVSRMGNQSLVASSEGSNDSNVIILGWVTPTGNLNVGVRQRYSWPPWIWQFYAVDSKIRADPMEPIAVCLSQAWYRNSVVIAWHSSLGIHLSTLLLEFQELGWKHKLVVPINEIRVKSRLLKLVTTRQDQFKLYYLGIDDKLKCLEVFWANETVRTFYKSA